MQTKSACGYSVHNLLLGPPGAGTSRLARRLTTIFPAMRVAEALDTTRIPRVAGRTGRRTALMTMRFCGRRACHLTARGLCTKTQN